MPQELSLCHRRSVKDCSTSSSIGLVSRHSRRANEPFQVSGNGRKHTDCTCTSRAPLAEVGCTMNDRRDPNTGELKRLLERLQELSPAPDGALPQRRFGEEAGQHLYQDDGYPDRRLLPPPAPRPL